MAENITSTTQFSTFSIIKSIIKNNSTLSQLFKEHNIFEYEPTKNSFYLPHVVVHVPSIEQDERTIGGSPVILKDVDVEIVMRMDYHARDNFRTYYGALINALEDDTTLESSGYIPLGTAAESAVEGLEYDKRFIEGVILFSLKGVVN